MVRLRDSACSCTESQLWCDAAKHGSMAYAFVLSELWCYAVKQECYDLLEGDPEGQAEAQMKLSVVYGPTQSHVRGQRRQLRGHRTLPAVPQTQPPGTKHTRRNRRDYSAGA
eukprot:1380166-Rhodomonas_salina.1